MLAIPCWWDASDASLAATIREVRPDLLNEFDSVSSPIPINPPAQFFLDAVVPEVGDLMLANFAADFWDPSNWWIGEKYDGVRACWNSRQQALYSSRGFKFNHIYHPDKFPNLTLDGEIWLGRGSYNEIKLILGYWQNVKHGSVVTSAVDDAKSVQDAGLEHDNSLQLWAHTKYVTFDAPSNDFCHVCPSRKSLADITTTIIEGEGEGVVLRAPDSPYEPGRSDYLKKFKSGRFDAEALVVDINAGAIILKLPSGKTFPLPYSVPCNKVGLGDWITFSYSYLTATSLPVDPVFLHVRHDSPAITEYDIPQSSALSDQALTHKLYRTRTPRKEYGYWTSSESKNVKEFVMNFALKRGMDPQVAESWYQITHEDLIREEGGVSVLKHYSNSLSKLLMDIFPNIGIKPYLFGKASQKFWDEPVNRKEFFESYAKLHNFDPLVATNWYDVSHVDLCSIKGAHTLVRSFPSYMDAIMDSFPNIGLERIRFKYLPKGYFADKERRKEFFDKVAGVYGFDALVARNWYTKTPTFAQIEKVEGGKTILRYYNNKIHVAIADVYPNVSSDAMFFTKSPRYYYQHLANRVQFFNNFAQYKGFDPKVASNWYKVTLEDVFNARGTTLLKMFDKSLFRALSECYPDIGLVHHLFRKQTPNAWANESDRRVFLDSVAMKRHFDPLQVHHWYAMQVKTMLSYKGGRSLLAYYNNSIANAVMDTYPTVFFDRNCFK